MEPQVSTDNTASDEANQAVLEEVKEVRIRFVDMPSYLQKVMKHKEALKTEYLSSKLQEKRIEYTTLCEAIEKEILLQQYRVYRLRRGKFRCYPEERKLYSHLVEYIQELVTKNHRARLCFLATREVGYKAKYLGTKNTVTMLVHALDERFHNDISFLLDNQMITMSFKE